MSFILVDLADEKHGIQINGWNWRPTVAILIEAGILPSGERAERCLSGIGCGGYFTKEEAARTADFLESLVARMKPEERVMADGSINDKPKNFNLPIAEWDEREAWDHYSASYEWLQMFIKFCRRSEGFEVS
jgi:hypothetical protein